MTENESKCQSHHIAGYSCDLEEGHEGVHRCGNTWIWVEWKGKKSKLVLNGNTTLTLPSQEVKVVRPERGEWELFDVMEVDE